MIPLWLFPDVVQNVSRYLPFQYTYQAPLEIYIGRIPPSGALPVLLIQAVWIVGLTVVLALIWRRAQARVIVQGG